MSIKRIPREPTKYYVMWIDDNFQRQVQSFYEIKDAVKCYDMIKLYYTNCSIVKVMMENA